MSDEQRDFLEHTQSWAKLRDGRELSPDEMAREFLKQTPEQRVTVLDSMQHTAPREMTAREAGRRVSYERALMRTHEMLNKIGR
jgi:hypothetical protein